MIEFLCHLTADIDRCLYRCILFYTYTYTQRLFLLISFSLSLSSLAHPLLCLSLPIFQSKKLHGVFVNIEHLHFSSWKSHFGLDFFRINFRNNKNKLDRQNWQSFSFHKNVFFFVLFSMNYSHFVCSSFKIMTTNNSNKKKRNQTLLHTVFLRIG